MGSSVAIVVPHSSNEITNLCREAATQVQSQLPRGLHCMLVVVDSSNTNYAYSYSPGLAGAFAAICTLLASKWKKERAI